MFIGFIPFLFATVALCLSFSEEQQAPAQTLWWVTAFLIVIWAVYHGSHHWSQFTSYAAW